MKHGKNDLEQAGYQAHDFRNARQMLQPLGSVLLALRAQQCDFRSTLGMKEW